MYFLALNVSVLGVPICIKMILKFPRGSIDGGKPFATEFVVDITFFCKVESDAI